MEGPVYQRKYRKGAVLPDDIDQSDLQTIHDFRIIDQAQLNPADIAAVIHDTALKTFGFSLNNIESVGLQAGKIGLNNTRESGLKAF